jgi:hypothetical protein
MKNGGPNFQFAISIFQFPISSFQFRISSFQFPVSRSAQRLTNRRLWAEFLALIEVFGTEKPGSFGLAKMPTPLFSANP